ncbi:hypothetical protein GCM10023169_13890 [Georgenia halophila]|uniref:Uncharacterized protein n=1 Tax=Georgenia halophila TaxID=620889 RepID=A0ABP8L2D8_9MICO
MDLADGLSRLNRNEGVGNATVSHSMGDLNALPTVEDREKAAGLVERAGMVVLGALPSREIPLLNTAVQLSRAEQELLQQWHDPPSWDTKRGRHSEPPPGPGEVPH